MNTYIQDSFKGGMNLQDCPDNLADDEYVWGVNVRVRDQRVTAVKLPSEDLAVPTGKKQGLVAFGDYLLVFVDGQAYWRRFDSTSWTQITGFQMSRTASKLYAAVVTGSSVNIQRKLANASGQLTYVTDGTKLASATGTPAGLLVQDGKNQPWIIFPDLTCRVTQTYDQWDRNTLPEYVPIGTEMAVVGVKLFIRSVDGKRVYQSVSGRMLDFVVNIDTDGNKGGNADTTSFGVSGDSITALSAASLTTLLIASKRQTWLVELDYTNTVFGEPSYTINPIVDAGITNGRSVIELLGNYIAIDYGGIRSFNAVMNFKFRGQNAPFSRKVSPLFATRTQSEEDTAAVAFDNYGIFSVFTQLGYGLMVYDSLLDKWVSIDITECTQVTHFAVTTGNNNRQLWALTKTGRVFQLFAGGDAEPMFMTRTYKQDQLNAEQQVVELHAQMEDSASGTLRVIPYVDSKRFTERSRTIEDSVPSLLWPIRFPIDFSSTDRVNVKGVPLTNLPYGRGFQAVLAWTGGGFMNSLQVSAQGSVSSQSEQQQVSYAGNARNS